MLRCLPPMAVLLRNVIAWMNDLFDSKIFERMSERIYLLTNFRMIGNRISPIFVYSNTRVVEWSLESSAVLEDLKLIRMESINSNSNKVQVLYSRIMFRYGFVSMFKFERILQNSEISNIRLFEQLLEYIRSSTAIPSVFQQRRIFKFRPTAYHFSTSSL